MEYTTQISIRAPFDEVVNVTIDALEDEGFGVLCNIDVQTTFERKLNEEFRQYRILGACNPALAHEGLNMEINLGALLPCNVVVYETDKENIIVSAIDPNQLVGITDNPALDTIATDVSERFERVLASVGKEFGSN